MIRHILDILSDILFYVCLMTLCVVTVQLVLAPFIFPEGRFPNIVPSVPLILCFLIIVWRGAPRESRK